MDGSYNSISQSSDPLHPSCSITCNHDPKHLLPLTNQNKKSLLKQKMFSLTHCLYTKMLHKFGSEQYLAVQSKQNFLLHSSQYSELHKTDMNVCLPWIRYLKYICVVFRSKNKKVKTCTLVEYTYFLIVFGILPSSMSMTLIYFIHNYVSKLITLQISLFVTLNFIHIYLNNHSIKMKQIKVLDLNEICIFCCLRIIPMMGSFLRNW
jgi:hypothetical protein